MNNYARRIHTYKWLFLVEILTISEIIRFFLFYFNDLERLVLSMNGVQAW